MISLQFDFCAARSHRGLPGRLHTDPLPACAAHISVLGVLLFPVPLLQCCYTYTL